MYLCNFNTQHLFYFYFLYIKLASQAQDSYQHSLENLLIMMFNQLSGVPTASHGYFLKHHIEALTLQGVKESDRQIKNFKYNSLKQVR